MKKKKCCKEVDVRLSLHNMRRTKMAIQENNSCPDKELITAFVECALPAETAGEVAMHVSHCEQCRKGMRELVLSKVKGKVRDWWAELRESFSPSREYLAAADGQTADQSQHDTAARSGFIHFTANLDDGDVDFWHVKLALPTVVTDESRLRMQVLDKDEQRIECGELTFCGAKLRVEDGRASMPVSEFRMYIKNPDNAMISLRRAAGREVEGLPVLAYDVQG